MRTPVIFRSTDGVGRAAPAVILVWWLASIAGCSNHQSVATSCNEQSAVEYFVCSGDQKSGQTSSPKIVAMRVAIGKTALSEAAHPKANVPVAGHEVHKP